MQKVAAHLVLFIALASLPGCAGSASTPNLQPVADTVHAAPADAGKRIAAKQGVVTSANALASDAGVEVLRAGGNAVDAAVATAFAIGVVEPQMSGLGGSGAATVWMAKDARPSYLDFYAAQFADSWQGSPALQRDLPKEVTAPDLRGTGIPGEVAGLLALHEKFGVLTREQVMAPAVRLAEEGFPVGKVLADFIAGNENKLKPYPAAMSLYFPSGKAAGPGVVLRNPELAESLRRVSREGRDGFYKGATADALIAALNRGGHPAGSRDFSEYQPQWKAPLCTDYRGLTVLSAPPPQTGSRVLHTLELLESFDLPSLGLPTRSPQAFDLITSALRAGQAGGRGNGDPNWAPIPARGIASAEFAATRRALVGTGRARPVIEPADAAPFDTAKAPGACASFDVYPPAAAAEGSGEQPAIDSGGETTHLSVVDQHGNAVSLTVTNSSVWGSGAFAAGFFLNDSGFRFTEQNINARSRSRWRIRTTTIAPTIVLKGKDVRMVIGAPGAGRIPTEIVQVMVYALDYGLDPLDAVRMPRIFATSGDARVQVEHGFTPELLRDVRAMGYDPVAESSGYARIYMIARRGDRWIGVADTRHDGAPRGY